MLHTDAAIALLTAGATSGGVIQISAASRVFEAMKSGRRADPRAQLFERRWLAFTASVYTSHGLLGYADRAIRDALTRRTGRADITARPGYFVAAASPSGSSRPR